MTNDLSRNTNLWNRLFVKKKFNPIYPSEEIQAFQRHHLKKASSKILDCGFGNGRNTFFLRSFGYNIFGIDSSIECVKNIKRNLNKSDGHKFKLNQFTKINFKNNFFDAVIADGVMYYADQENINNGINEIYRVLKKGGVARINLKTNKEKFFEYSKLKKKGGGGLVKNGWEKNLLVTTHTRKQVVKLFEKFAKTMIGIHEFNFINYKKKHSFWVVTAIK